MARLLTRDKAYPYSIFFVLFAVTFAVQTNASDPLNPIKFWLLGLFSIWAASKIVVDSDIRNRVEHFKQFKFFLFFLILFFVTLFLAFIFTDVKSIGLIGDTGRNLGFLNYLFLGVISCYAAFKFNLANIRALYVVVIFISATLMVYGIFQHFGHDIFRWVTNYNPIILFTGNPDFASSLLGLFSVLIFSMLFMEFGNWIRLLLGFLDIFLLLVTYWAGAKQGLVTAAAGIGFILLIYFWNVNRKIGLTLLCVEVGTGIFSVLGMLQIGPLTRIFFKPSITDRGYDWRAAVGMFKSHPFFGVGIDRYAAYFFQFRSPNYPLLYGYQQTVTNAHNVLLQLLSTGGIFVALSYFVLVAFISVRALVVVRIYSGKEKFAALGIVAGWIVYLAQSIISVDAQVLSIWGWVLGGAIVGLSSKGNFADSETYSKKKNLARARFSKNYLAIRTIIFGTLIASFMLILIPMYRCETLLFKFLQYQRPLNNTQVSIYKGLADQVFGLPLINPNYRKDVSLQVAKQVSIEDSIPYFLKVIEQDSRNTDVRIMVSIGYEELKNEKQAIIYREQVEKLDPYGAENLLALEKDYLVIGDKKSAIRTKDSILKIAPGTEIALKAIREMRV